MVRKVEQDRVRDLLIEAVTVLCQNGLPYESKLRVQGLLGITLDDKDIFLVDIKHEVDKGNMAEIEVSEGTSSENEQQEGSLSSPRRRKRRRRRSGNRPDGDRADSEEPQIKRPSSDSQDGFEIKQEIKEEIDDTGEPEPGCSAWPGIAGEESSPLAMGQPIPAPQQVNPATDHRTFYERPRMFHTDPDLQAVMQMQPSFQQVDTVTTGNWPFPERPKPSVSMIELAGLAVYKTPSKQLSLNEIVNFIQKWFPYYSNDDKKWQSSLKQTVSRNVGQCFIKLPRSGIDNFSNYAMNADFALSFESKLPYLRTKVHGHMDAGFLW